MSGINPDDRKTPPSGQSSPLKENSHSTPSGGSVKISFAAPHKENTKFILAPDLRSGMQKNFIAAKELMATLMELEALPNEGETLAKMESDRSALFQSIEAMQRLADNASNAYYSGRTLLKSDTQLVQEFKDHLENFRRYWSDVGEEMASRYEELREEKESREIEKRDLARKKEESAEDAESSPKFDKGKKPVTNEGQTATDKPQKPKTFSDTVKEVQKIDKISWADLVEEELRKETREKIESTQTSLISTIRSKTGISKENRIEIPINLKDALPQLYERLEMASRLCKCDLVENGRVEIKLTRPIVWGSDEAARNNVLATLYDETGAPKKELMDIANLAVLIDSALEIPGEEALTLVGPGRLGVYHVLNLFTRVFCEQIYDVPIAKQRNWYKAGQNIRNEMSASLASQMGGVGPANCVMNAFDILYRKFVRRVMKSHDNSSKEKLSELAQALSKKLFTTGGGLFSSLLRTEKRSRKKKVETLSKTGKSKTEIVEEQYIARIRPSITDGPKTPFESSLYAKVNGALAKIESRAVNYDLTSTSYDSPASWENAHKTWVDSLYLRTKIPSHLMVQRKQHIRAKIMGRMHQELPAGTQNVQKSNSSQKITADQWKSQELLYIKENEADFDQQSIAAVNQMLKIRLEKDALIDLSEDAVIDILSKLG